jgi:CubicO group peptidase (beta-lactamase class C family)
LPKFLIAVLVAVLGCGGGNPSQPPAPLPDAAPSPDGETDGGADPLDDFIRAHMQTAKVPGLAAVVVKGNQVVLARGFGDAVIESHQPVTPDTLFMLASISKTVTSVALLQLYEQAQFALDDDVNAKLGYSVRNPAFANQALSYRMLLTHTSSIEDGQHFADYYVYDRDSPIALDDFVHGYLVSGGAYYDASNWNAGAAPGTHYSYSNAGVALAGDLVEKISAANLQAYCKQHIFEPLGMHETSFFLRDLDRTHIAMPYETDASGNYQAAGYYGYPDYPDGQLRTSAPQLARFLMAIIGHGEFGGARILMSTTIDEMLRQQPSSQEGLSWEYAVLGGHHLVGHSGADSGVSTDMYFDPSSGAGIVVLTNGDIYVDATRMAALIDIDTALLERGEQF